MKQFSTSQIRETFLKFFADKAHTVVASSSLVPANDPTLMFTNSGMVQFKDVFLGHDKRPYVRAASCQACLRAGGKHNDLENVGYTARHHTFFEMLGNWSFGDYFKHDSIVWGWELLTKVYGLDANRLMATVYFEDDEAYDIWTKVIGLPPERVVRIGDNKGKRYASDNFWMMADTGPCGPCSEIFYDHGAHIPGGPPGSPDEDGDRFIEIWNHVFMQFDMKPDGSVVKLPAPCVDTGMGLERLAAILQGKHSNYEIDLFAKLIKAAARETNCADINSPSLKVLADHIRACAFLIADGVIPGNEGRGYVLRRITRRAIRHGYKLGVRQPFFYKLIPDLVAEMSESYPNLLQNQKRISEMLAQEEERFFQTIEHGMTLVDKGIDVAKDETYALELKKREPKILNYKYERINEHEKKFLNFYKPNEKKIIKQGQAFNDKSMSESWTKFVITKEDQENIVFENIETNIQFNLEKKVLQKPVFSGTHAFILHDTYGFPLDLTQDICREQNVAVDIEGFNLAMENQKEQARTSGKFKSAINIEYSGKQTNFYGYEKLELSANILALYKNGTSVNSLSADDVGIIVLDNTPFYAESGGQVGDSGLIININGNAEIKFVVSDTQKIQPNVFGHHGKLICGKINVGDKINAQVDVEKRMATMRNHSVTHIMHKALREVLGSHVEQKGSLVDAEKTRFDFAHNKQIADAELRKIEQIVNLEIINNNKTSAEVMDIESAKKSGAIMLFGEKYGETVRVLTIGSSKEFCGGTHVSRTGDIGLFTIISESGVAAGIRRLEAITGVNAINYLQIRNAELSEIAKVTKSPEIMGKVLNTVKNLQEEKLQLVKDISKLKTKIAHLQITDLIAQSIDINGTKLITANIEDVDNKILREMLDNLREKLISGIIVLSTVIEGKVSLIVGISSNLMGKFNAGEIANAVAKLVDGKGGGKADTAMAGGNNPKGLLNISYFLKCYLQNK